MLTGVGLIVFGLLIGWILECIKDHISPRSFVFMVSLLYALACGQLIGGVMIHALPKVYQSSKTKMEIVALIVMSAICFFILIERTIKHCGNEQQPQGFLDHDHKDDDEDPGMNTGNLSLSLGKGKGVKLDKWSGGCKPQKLLSKQKNRRSGPPKEKWPLNIQNCWKYQNSRNQNSRRRTSLDLLKSCKSKALSLIHLIK